MNFWQKMKEEKGIILCLAPMADVTDAAFRFLISKYSKKIEQERFSAENYAWLSEKEVFENFFKNQPNSFITFTEFVSADGLALAPEEGRKKLLKNLEFSEIERPIVAQFFGSHPETMEKAAELAVSLGFDGMDINMGCPDRSVEKQKAGAALIKNPSLAKELIIAAKVGWQNGLKIQDKNLNHQNKNKESGVQSKDLKSKIKNQNNYKLENREEILEKFSEDFDNIPVSVKTRIGYNRNELETWLPELLSAYPAAITIHARTRKEMSKVPADWERIKRAVEIRDNFETVVKKNQITKTLIIGNGDVKSIEDANKKCKETGADGAMLGRAVFGNPWVFSDLKPIPKERLEVLVEHIKLFDEKLGKEKSFAVMKKHFKSYLQFASDFKDDREWKNLVKKLRTEMMESKNSNEAANQINDFLNLL